MTNPQPTGTVTFLFTDIEGSTKMWDRYPTQMEVALARHDQILRQTIEDHNGYVFKTIGDAFCAAFASTREALMATMVAQRALFNEKWPANIKVRVRVALHTGAAEERDGDFFGPPVNRVARLLSAGHGGQVLLSAVTYGLVRDALPHLEPRADLKDMGEHRLRDLRHSERIYQLIAPDLPKDFPDLKTLDTRSGERYNLKKFLGSGGMAEVYLAHDTELDRDVAFKVLRDQYADDEEFIKRFEQEARSAASLAHTNVVSVYDRGRTQDGAYYIVMECATGGDLKERIKREGPLSPPEALSLTLQIARALQSAHRRKIVHRDIKPQNVLLTEEGEVKVADFGLARAAAASTMTKTGFVMGTAHYLSPEQALGEPATPRSDLYALGVVLYEMLTGELPHDAETPMGIVMKHVEGQLRPPTEIDPGVPKWINAITVRLMARKPEDRYQDAAELIEDLERVQRGKPPEFLETPPVPPDPPRVPTVRVPNLAGQHAFQASNTLANGGLTLGGQNEVPSDTIPRGVIVGQSPDAGTEIEQGSLVSVTISSGPRPPVIAGPGAPVRSPTVVAPERAGHSLMGIASLVLSLLTGIVMILLFVGAVAIEPNTEGPLTILLGIGIFASPFVYLITLGLGVAGIFQQQRKRLFAILATVLSGLALAVAFLLFLFGIVGALL